MVAANGKLFVGQLFSEHIVVFDILTMWPVKRLPLGGDGLFAASADGRTVYYASNERHAFYAIDTDSYAYRPVPYPAGGRGIGAVAVSPDGRRLYLGIQRGGQAPDRKERTGGNSFLAAYDLPARRYAGTVYLAQVNEADGSDDSLPASMLLSRDGRLLYVGMSQSLAGVRVVDTARLRLRPDISFEPGPRNTTFRWVDPVGLAWLGGRLLSANRNNGEVAVVDPSSHKVLARLTLADPRSRVAQVLVRGNRIYLSDEASRRVYVFSGRRLVRLLTAAARAGTAGRPLEVMVQPR
jgi:DNA-binding beta-propeller fold protein YncE